MTAFVQTSGTINVEQGLRFVVVDITTGAITLGDTSYAESAVVSVPSFIAIASFGPTYQSSPAPPVAVKDPFAEWLRSDNAQRTLLVEAKYWDVDAAAEEIVYLASMPFVSRPTDAPSNQPYDDAVAETPRFTSTLNDALEGYTVPTWGDISIRNPEFDKDAWLNHSWYGRDVRLLFGDVTWPRIDFKTILNGTNSGISAPSSAQIRMSVKDKQWMLNGPVQNRLIGDPVVLTGRTYKVAEMPVDSIDAVWDNGALLPVTAYTTDPTATPPTFTLNEDPVGLLSVHYTGGPTATGQVIPLCYGEVYNVKPMLLSEPDVLYQVHDGAIKDIVQVRAGGVPVDFIADLAKGTFALAAQPVGEVTCDVQGALSEDKVWIEGAGRIARHLILTRTSLTESDIDVNSLCSFVEERSQRVGIYIDSRRNTLDVLDELIRSVGGFYTPSRMGKLIFGRIDIPSGKPAMELTADDIIEGGLKIVKQSVPVQTMRLAYLQNYTPQSSVHGAVSDEDRMQYAAAWRYVKRADPSIKTAHPLAGEPDAKKTLLADRTEAQAEAERLFNMKRRVWTTYTAECYTVPLTLNLGDIVSLTHPRYGLASGKLLYVVGISESATKRRVTLTLTGV